MDLKLKSFSTTVTSGTSVLTIKGIDYYFPPLKFILISEFISMGTLEQKLNFNMTVLSGSILP